MHNSPFNSQSVGKHTLLLVSFLILTIASSFAMFTNYSNYVIYPVFVLWLPYVWASANILSKNEHTFVRVSILYLMVVLIYWLIGYSSTGLGNIMVVFNWIMTGVIAVYVRNMFSERELSIVYVVLLVAVVVLMIVFIKTGRYLMVMEDMNEAAGVANAWYGSLFMLLSGLSLIAFIHVKSWFPKIVAIASLLLSVYLNFFVLQRGINVIFTMAEIGLIIVFTLRRKEFVYLFSIVIIVAAIYMYASGLLIDVFDWLADIIPSDRLAHRFKEISNALLFEDMQASAGSLSARSKLIGVSWDTFTSSIGHFIFGAGEHSKDNMIIGHHSFFVDTFARYGIIGGGLNDCLF